VNGAPTSARRLLRNGYAVRRHFIPANRSRFSAVQFPDE
jgi:hypothetical protein